MEAVRNSGEALGKATEYYPQGAGMVERGHQLLKNGLVKMCWEDGKKWRHYLPMILFAERISVKRGTGYSPLKLLFGQQAVLPVDLEAVMFLAVDWAEVKTTEQLLEARAEQLLRR